MIDLGLLRNVLASEWTKLRSVRSTYWTILVAIILGIGLSCAISAGSAHAYSHFDLKDRLTFDPAATSLSGLFFAQLALGVFAILMISTEYSTGLIRSTLSAVPQRGYVLAAKAILVAVVGTVIGVGVAFASFTLGQLIFATKHLNVHLSQPGVLRAVFGAGLYIGVLVVFGLGIAIMVRHSAAAITVLVAFVFVIPIVSNLLPDSLQHDISRYLPAQAGSAILNVVPQGSDALAPWVGFGVFVAWAAVSLLIGWYLLRSRDV